MTPKVSVIIPVYNVEKYLAECLESVINQTLKEIEIIIINDGSPDNSLAIAKEYAKKDDRIILVSQENKGLGATRNVGMKMAKGEYIYFIDSDDWIALDALEKLYSTAKKEGLEIIEGGVIQIDEQKKEKKIPHSTNNNILNGKANLLNNKNLLNAVWCRLYKLNFLIENELYCSEGIYYEDVEFTLNAFLKAKRIKSIDYNFYYYRFNSESISNKPIITEKHWKSLENVCNFFDINIKFYQQDKLVVHFLTYRYLVFLHHLNSLFFASGKIKIKDRKTILKKMMSWPYPVVKLFKLAPKELLYLTLTILTPSLFFYIKNLKK